MQYGWNVPYLGDSMQYGVERTLPRGQCAVRPEGTLPSGAYSLRVERTLIKIWEPVREEYTQNAYLIGIGWV